MTPPITETTGIEERRRNARILARLIFGYQWLARREMLACAAVLILALGLRAALLPWSPVPQPSVHDEFSYLLAADTYAHGRLTNPPHPFWQHFETFHVLQQPTYISKYQPLQALVMAFGQKFFGEPWIGVYLSVGLMCATVCWMLQGWISPEWALLGALLCTLRVGILSYWMNSYMGGAVPAIGGALALGAAVRIWRRGQFGHSITWAVGLAVVGLSRPYDATVLAVVSGAMLLWFLRRSHTPLSHPSLRTIGRRVALPALAVLTVCAAGIAYNDYRVTGNPLTLPYQAHERQYGVVSMFTLIPLRPEPSYNHPLMRHFYADWNGNQRTYSLEHPVMALVGKICMLDNFFFPFWVLLMPVLLCPYDWETPEEGATVLLLLICVLMLSLLIAAEPHYAAVFVGVFYLRFLHSLTRLARWRPWAKPIGRVLAVLLVGLMVGGMGYNFLGLIREGHDKFKFTSGLDMFTGGIEQRGERFESDRGAIIRALEQQPGPQLVMVRYAKDHDPQDEWVYNRADIDASKIVWAREMGPEQDRPFLKYFRARRIWLVEPDHSPATLSPYPGIQ